METRVFLETQATPAGQDSPVSPAYQVPRATPASPALDCQDPPALKDSQAHLVCQVVPEVQEDQEWTASPVSQVDLELRESQDSGCQVPRALQASLDPKDYLDPKETPVSPATPARPDVPASTVALVPKVTLVSMVYPEPVDLQVRPPSALRASPAPLDPQDPWALQGTQVPTERRETPVLLAWTFQGCQATEEVPVSPAAPG